MNAARGQAWIKPSSTAIFSFATVGGTFGAVGDTADAVASGVFDGRATVSAATFNDTISFTAAAISGDDTIQVVHAVAWKPSSAAKSQEADTRSTVNKAQDATFSGKSPALYAACFF